MLFTMPGKQVFIAQEARSSNSARKFHAFNSDQPIDDHDSEMQIV